MCGDFRTRFLKTEKSGGQEALKAANLPSPDHSPFSPCLARINATKRYVQERCGNAKGSGNQWTSRTIFLLNGGTFERFFGFSLNPGTEILGRREAVFLCQIRFGTILKNNPHINRKTTEDLTPPDFWKISLTPSFVREAGLEFENQTCVIRADDFPQ